MDASLHPFLDARRMPSKRSQRRAVGSCGSCNSSLSDSSYNSRDEDGYEDDDEDSIGPLPGLQRHNKPLPTGRPSRRHRIEFIERRPNVHSRRLPYRLPDALILPPPPPPPPLVLRRFQSIQSPQPPPSLENTESQFLMSRKSSFMEQGPSEDEIKRPDPPEQQMIQRSMLPSVSAKRPHHQYHHHVSSSTSSSTTMTIPGTVNTTARATMRKAIATRTLPYNSSSTFLVQQQEHENDPMYKKPKLRRLVSLPLFGRSNNATKSPPAPQPSSFWTRRRSKSIAATFDGVVGVSTIAKDKKTNAKKSQLLEQQPASPPVAFLARRSKSIAKTFDSVVGNNSSSTPTTVMTSTISEMDDVWIERVLLRQGRPLHFYFQSVFSKKIQAEPPTGAIHVIYWDDLLRVGVNQQRQQQQLHQQHGRTTVVNKAKLGNCRSDTRSKTGPQNSTKKVNRQSSSNASGSPK